jgi:hypothetical protein
VTDVIENIVAAVIGLALVVYLAYAWSTRNGSEPT